MAAAPCCGAKIFGRIVLNRLIRMIEGSARSRVGAQSTGQYRGSGQPGESIGAQTSRPCLGPDPRNPSGPAVTPTAQQRPGI
jgi:hypothetical protein